MRISGWIIGAVVCALMVASPVSAAQTTNITLLYTGDTHGHLRSFYYGSRDPVGGISKRAIFFQEKRRHQGMIWLTLDSGDALSGTMLADVFEGSICIDAMNRLGYDAMGLGVQDFDFGVEVLRQRIADASFPVLCANIHNVSTGATLATPYVILERNGVRIAVMGLVTGDLASRVASENFTGLSVANPIETAKQMIPLLESQSDVIIALTHLGINGDIQLASEVRGIDVIVGGMSHSELHVPMKFEDTLIVHDSEFGHSVGMLKLSFDPQQNNKRVYFTNTLEPMAGKWVENTNYIEWLDSFNEPLRQRMETIVGASSMRMSETKVRSSETPLGNYVADTLRMSTGADLALLPAALFQGPLPEGAITLGDLYALLPYDHYAVVLDVTGGELKQIFDDAASQIGKPGFPQISGASFGILNDAAYTIRIGGHDLDLFRHYKLVTSDALADGQHGYSSLGTVQTRSYSGKLIRDLLRERLASGQAAQSTVYQRISFHAYDPAMLATAGTAPPTASIPESTPITEAPGTTPAVASTPEPVLADSSTTPTGAASSESFETADTAATETPAYETTPTEPATEDLGLDSLRYDRNGQPIGDPVTVHDEVITDSGSDLAPSTLPSDPAPETEPDAYTHTPPVTMPGTPDAPVDALGLAHATESGLDYVFSLVPKGESYVCQLVITNVSVMPTELNYDTKMKVDFVVMDNNDLVWNYNFNRFYLQKPLIETLAPGETLTLTGEWDGLTNDNSVPGSNNLRFEAVHQLSGKPVYLRFDSQLSQ